MSALTQTLEAAIRRYSVKKVFLKIIHRKTPVPQVCNFIKNMTLTQVLFCETFKNTFSYRTPLLAASEKFKEMLVHM